MKLSVGGFSFFNTMKEGKMNVFGYLETMKYRYRLDTVDLWNGQLGRAEDGLVILPEEDDIRKIREALDEKELAVANIAIDGAHMIDPEPGMQEKLYRNALVNLRVSELLGAKTVRIDICTGKTDEITEGDFQYIVQKYREYCDRATKHGYIVGPENHMGAALNPHLLKRIAEAVDHPNFGILLHLNRWKPEFADGDSIVAPWVVHTHVDAETVMGQDFGVSIQALLKAGYDGYWAVEYNAKENQYTEIEWMLATVKRIVNQNMAKA
jgi:sugar phosphate isomerase/epimerase